MAPFSIRVPTVEEILITCILLITSVSVPELPPDSAESRRAPDMSEPLYKLKAEFFKTLGHPARIRLLELLVERDRTVSELLPEVGLEPSNLSQQLAVLRRAGVVVTAKEGSTVIYSIASPTIAELLAVARKVLAGLLSDQAAILDDLRAAR